MQQANNLPRLILGAAERYAHPDLLCYPHEHGWIRWSSVAMTQQIRALTMGLIARGVQRGDRIGIIAPPGPEWVMIDLAIQSAGAVTVPIFKRISPESFTHEVKDSGMRILFIGEPNEIPMAVEHGAGLVELITFGCCTDNEEFEQLLAAGRELDEHDRTRFDRSVASIEPDDLLTIIYTSGSTGLPKGVELTQSNLLSQIAASASRFQLDPHRDLALSLLPLAHIFERMVAYFYLASGMRVYFADDPKKVAEYARDIRPTAMTVVPRLLEKVYAKMKDGAQAKAGPAGKLARAAVGRAEAKPVESRRSVRDLLFDRLVYKKFRAALGGRVHTLISGSAKLAPEIAAFFINVGLNVYEGYGMTESAPVIAVNYRGHRRVGTVGPLLPQVEVTIAPDGEILARGPNVMRGYHNLPEASAETIDRDGWLHTGDLGSLDDDGYLTVTGRKKELFKKSTGEYVPPVPIEHAIGEHPLVDTAVIFADNRVYVTALLFPDPVKLSAARQNAGLSNMTDAEYLRSDAVRTQLQEHIESVNRARHHCERVVQFTFAEDAASIERGELTPTYKVRRANIERLYQDKIEAMYANIGGTL